MIFALQQPDWDVECKAIHDFLQDTLDYVAKVANFGLEAYLEDNPARKGFVGRKKNVSATRKALEQAAGAEDKVAFCNAHRSDRAYASGDAVFRFAHHVGGFEWSKPSKDTLIEAYSSVLHGRGFYDLPGLPSSTVIDAGWVKEKYRQKNGRTGCPYCGNYLTLDRCHLDHFFPKGKYPTLAVTLSNLVPACECNSIFKGERDPLKDRREAGGVHSLCLPYSGRSLAEHLDLKFSTSPRGLEEVHQVQVDVKAETPTELRAPVTAFIELVQLQANWNGVLPHLHDVALCTLEYERANAQITSLDDMRSSLQRHAADNAAHLNKGGYPFLASRYYLWLAEQKSIIKRWWSTLALIPLS